MEKMGESEEMGELMGVARGILGALQELVKVGKEVEEEVEKWVKVVEMKGKGKEKELAVEEDKKEDEKKEKEDEENGEGEGEGA